MSDPLSSRDFRLRWRFWIGGLVSGAFLFLAFRRVDWGELGVVIQRANYVYLVPAVVLILLGMWMRAYRWRFLLEPVKRIRVSSLFSATMIGFMANNLLPARLGELARAYAIGRKEQISKSSSFATILVERVFDGITLLLFIVVGLVFFAFPLWMRRGGYVAAFLFVSALVVLVLLRIKTQSTLSVVGALLRPFPERVSLGVKRVLSSFVDGLQVLGRKNLLLTVALLSVVLWLLMPVVIWLLLLSFDLSLPLYASLVLLVALSLAVMIPSSPGFIGTVQFFSVATLALFLVPKAQALGFSVVYHASQFIPITLLGLFFFWQENLSFRTLANE